MPHDASELELVRTGMAQAVLCEVAQALQQLAAQGEASAIDLRGLPMTDADRQELEALLGRGEVEAQLQVAGRTLVWETAYAGVWWIRHLGDADRIASEEIAIAAVPEILLAHRADIAAASARLQQELVRNTVVTVEGDLTHVRA